MGDFSDFKWQDWRSGVPAQQTIVQQTTAQPAKLAGSMTAAAFDSARLVTGIAWGGLQDRTGAVPAGTGDLESFTQLGSMLRDLPAGAFDDVGNIAMACVDGGGGCADAVLDAQINAIISVFGSLASNTPVLGWIIQGIAFGVAVGKVIWAEAQDPPEPTVAPLMLDQAADQDAGERIVSALDGPDWTGIWMPPHDGTGASYFNHAEVEYGTGYKGGRVWLGDQGGQMHSMGEGLLPGQSAAAEQWQYRGKQASTGSTRLDALANFFGLPIAHGSGAASDIGKVTTYGIDYFRPSLAQLNQLLWGEINKVGGEAMFRVNVEALSIAWDAYWGQWQAVMNHFAEHGTDEQARIIWNVLIAGTSMPAGWNLALRKGGDLSVIPERYRVLQLGGPRVVGSEEVYLGSDTGCMPCTIDTYDFRWGKEGSLTWSVTKAGITRYMLDSFRERQEYALRTLMVAYLTGNEPGLGGKGSALFLEWETNREALLSSPHLQAVDFSRVPKVDYTGTGEWRSLAVSKKIGGQVALPAMAPPPKVVLPLNVWGQGGFPTEKTSGGLSLAPAPASGMAGAGAAAVLLALMVFGGRR